MFLIFFFELRKDICKVPFIFVNLFLLALHRLFITDELFFVVAPTDFLQQKLQSLHHDIFIFGVICSTCFFNLLQDLWIISSIELF